ncbi:MAG TPA: FecR domain-containing protein [Flavobacteriales bacterium]
MDEGAHIPSELLAGYLSGEADPEARLRVEQWAAGDPANARELERMRALWRLSGEGDAAPEVDVDAAWRKLEQRLDRRTPVVRTLNTAVRKWIAAAAMLAGLVIAVQLLMRPASRSYVAESTMRNAVLEDSSRITLSPHSKLAARFGDERNIRLEGQAYFEVKRDEQRPFIVDAGEVEVKVLGTAFEVTAFDTARTVTVRVRHGKVRVAGAGRHVDLTAGQHVQFDKVTRELLRTPNMAMEVWGDRILQFEKASLAQVAQRLQELYGVRIELGNEAIGRCMLTANFENEPIGQVLQVIAATFGLQVEAPTGDRYILQGDGC